MHYQFLDGLYSDLMTVSSAGSRKTRYGIARMSASGYKQTFQGVSQNVRLAPTSGRKWVTEFMSAFDPKRECSGFFGD